MNNEQIKTRMVRTAARLWNIPDHEIESGFDPLVLLLIEACAAELGKLSAEMDVSQSRMMDQLASLLIPEASTGVRPASCVISAKPAETFTVIRDTTAFTLEQLQRTFFFTPIGDFMLHNARLCYALAGKKMFAIRDNGGRELLQSGGESNKKINELLLVIEPEKAVTQLKGLSLHFQFRNNVRSSAFYSHLRYTRAWLGEKEIRLEPGYYNADQFELVPETMLTDGNDISRRINRQLAALYAHSFLHIADEQGFQSGIHPPEITDLLSRQQLQKMNAERFIYLKLRFDKYYEPEELESLVCSINAFPIVNRKFNTRNHRTDPWVNIIPLQSDSSFLDLHSITASDGSPYRHRTAADESQFYEGEAILRSAGVGKPGAAEVRNSISRLVDTIRNESAFFSNINNEFVLSRLKEMNQVLARLEDQLSRATDKRTDHHYVLLKTKKPGDTVTIHYWTTDAAAANQQSPGKFLSAYNHALINSNDAFTITPITGGKGYASETEKKLLFQQQLLSRGKIVSAGDVKLLCRIIFGANLQTVSVEKGVSSEGGSKEGFSRTIDIRLRFANPQSPDLDYQISELKHQLHERATMVYPFRITCQP